MSFTTDLEKFFDNNTPGGYIQTKVNISNDDLNERINTILNGKSFLTSNSHLPYTQIDGRPALAPVATSGDYNDLIHTPTIEQGGGNINVDLATVATTGRYTDLINRPDKDRAFANIAFSGNFNDLINVPSFVKEEDLTLSRVATTGDYNDLLNAPNFQGLIDSGSINVEVNSAKVIPIYNLTQSRVNPLKYLAAGMDVDTTQLMFNNDNETTVDDWLAEIISLYQEENENNANCKSILIKIISGKGQLFLNNLVFENNVYEFTFSGLDTNGYNNITLTDTPENFQTIQYHMAYFYFLYNKNQHKLYIRSCYTPLSDNFHNVAFSGDYTTLINRPSYEDIFNGIKDNFAAVASSGSYTDLLNVPTDEQIFNNIKDNFATISITGNYADLNNKPSLKQVALTGKYTDLTNLPDLDFINNIDLTLSTNTILRNLNDGKINTLDKFNENDSSSDIIENILTSFINNFNNNKNKIFSFNSLVGRVFINNITNINNNYFFSFTPLSINLNPVDLSTLGTTDGDILNNLTFYSYFVYFIFDKNNHNLWIKRREIETANENTTHI